MEEVSKGSAPVRQLIARFDGTRDSGGAGEVMGKVILSNYCLICIFTYVQIKNAL